MKEKKFVSVPLEVKQTGDEGEFFTFEGFASTFGNTDLDGDIIERGAFTESLKKRIPKLVYQHDITSLLGKFTFIEEREAGLFVRAEMPKAVDLVKGTEMPLVKQGALDSMSIGFFIIEDTFNKEIQTRTITQIDLFEVSLVSIPANPQAVITSFKKADMDNFFNLTRKEQEKLFVGGVKFSKLTAKHLISVLRHKEEERKATESLGAYASIINTCEEERKAIETQGYEKLIQNCKE